MNTLQPQQMNPQRPPPTPQGAGNLSSMHQTTQPFSGSATASVPANAAGAAAVAAGNPAYPTPAPQPPPQPGMQPAFPGANFYMPGEGGPIVNGSTPTNTNVTPTPTFPQPTQVDQVGQFPKMSTIQLGLAKLAGRDSKRVRVTTTIKKKPSTRESDLGNLLSNTHGAPPNGHRLLVEPDQFERIIMDNFRRQQLERFRDEYNNPEAIQNEQPLSQPHDPEKALDWSRKTINRGRGLDELPRKLVPRSPSMNSEPRSKPKPKPEPGFDYKRLLLPTGGAVTGATLAHLIHKLVSDQDVEGETERGPGYYAALAGGGLAGGIGGHLLDRYLSKKSSIQRIVSDNAQLGLLKLAAASDNWGGMLPSIDLPKAPAPQRSPAREALSLARNHPSQSVPSPPRTPAAIWQRRSSPAVLGGSPGAAGLRGAAGLLSAVGASPTFMPQALSNLPSGGLLPSLDPRASASGSGEQVGNFGHRTIGH